MARISGVDIPREKRVEISLRYIFGVSPTVARSVCVATNAFHRTKNGAKMAAKMPASRQRRLASSQSTAPAGSAINAVRVR